MSVKNVWFSFYGDGSDVSPWEFEQLKNGHIQCHECGTAIWCQHIEKAIANNADAEGIWSYLEDDLENIDTTDVQVPMFPTSNLWVKVDLHFHPKTGAYKAFLNATDLPDLGFEVFLGFLHPGEGRMVMRSLILDWFQGFLSGSNLDLKCLSRSHKPKQEMEWQKAMRNWETRMVEHWSVWAGGSCTFCNNPDSGNAWPDDLIPDDKANKRPVF